MQLLRTIGLLIGLTTLTFVGCEKDAAVNDPCSLEPDPGPCEGYFPKYYYDQNESQCKQFIWGGCSGVVPFETLAECEQECE